jgi:starch phosphorylase
LLLPNLKRTSTGQWKASLAYLDVEGWSRKSILNVAHMGRFSSDRAVGEYAQEICRVNPVPVKPL